ncbi:peroxiredoxin-like family protein [Shewanella maritima]|uniref:peroxiredoxin-like family protein n=1 Tax=Shewanella maritima TaxID=2520507 RepID=UPI003735F8CB
MLKKVLLTVATALLTLNAYAKPIAVDENNISPLLNGHNIPDVTLSDIKGNKVNLAELTQSKPTVFFFYRGGWCPFCNIQMGQLKAIEPKLIEMGFQLVGISPDSPASLRESMTENELSYLLLSDENLAAAKAFGLAFFTSKKVTDMYQSKLNVGNKLYPMDNGEQRLVLPVPAIYIADNTGLIHFQYANPNYKVRPASELIMTAAKLVVSK